VASQTTWFAGLWAIRVKTGKHNGGNMNANKCKDTRRSGSWIPLAIIAVAALIWTLATTPAGAAEPITSYTATGHCATVCYAGDTLAVEGTSQLRNHVHVVKVESAATQIAGRRTFLMHGIANTNGTMRIYGSWQGELGAWTGEQFTPTSGVWDGTWNGTQQADGSFSISLVGRGSGGSIEALQLQETGSRPAGTPNDPAVAIRYNGKLGPEDGQWYQMLFSDQFQAGPIDPWSAVAYAPSTMDLVESGGSLTLIGMNMPNAGGGVYALADRPYNLINGQTLELRVDLVEKSKPGNYCHIAWQSPAGVYWFGLTDDFLSIAKYFFATGTWADFALDFLKLKSHNVTLVLSLTAFGQDTILTAQLLDKDENNKVLYSKSVTDTPSVDRPGDRAGSPWRTTSYGPFLGLTSFNPGTVPQTSAKFDNFEVRRYSAPALVIDQAVRVRWPAVDTARILESAPEGSGPWSPVLEPAFEQNGIMQVTILPSEPAKFFRLK
jgi:hypothetical protein